MFDKMIQKEQLMLRLPGLLEAAQRQAHQTSWSTRSWHRLAILTPQLCSSPVSVAEEELASNPQQID